MKIEVVSYETGEVVKALDCAGKSESAVDRIERGMNVNLDHERFYTRQVKQ